jgi:RNA-binding protein
MSSANGLTPAQRQALKGRAHKLAPVVWIGGGGLTVALLGEVERALAAHALIKIQASGLERAAREAALAELCARCGAQPVQHIGKVLVLYRPKPTPETAPAPRRARPPLRAGSRGTRDSAPAKRDAKRAARPRTKRAR